jgi:hypothetical protein
VGYSLASLDQTADKLEAPQEHTPRLERLQDLIDSGELTVSHDST